MEQQRIWDHFQTGGLTAFEGAAGRYAKMVATVRRLTPPGARVLNIGIGRGSVERQLLQLGYAVASLDPSEAAVQSLLAAGIEARAGFAEAIPFEASCFDVVIASEVLEHISDDVRPAVYREIARVLRRPGWLIGSVPYQEDLKESAVVCPDCGKVFHRWGHVASFRREDVQRELGWLFDVIDCRRLAFIDWKAASSPTKLAKAVIREILGRMGESIASPSVFFVATTRHDV